jgi:hypothetical protein
VECSVSYSVDSVVSWCSEHSGISLILVSSLDTCSGVLLVSECDSYNEGSSKDGGSDEAANDGDSSDDSEVSNNASDGSSSSHNR